MIIVVKIGGTALEDAATLRKCARAVAELAQDGHRVAVVHGGGSALTRVLKQLGKESEFVSGLRITDAETRDVALMVLGGPVMSIISYTGFLFVPLGHGSVIQPSCATLGGLFLAAVLLRERISFAVLWRGHYCRRPCRDWRRVDRPYRT